MSDRGAMEILHASAVVTRGGVAALCARSGTGKSTLAGHLRQRGYDKWADDALRWVRTDASALAFPERAAEDPRELTAVFVLERFEGAEATIEVEPVSGVSALTSVLVHAHPSPSEDLARRSSFVASYAHMAATVPIFRVRFPSDLSQLPALGDAFERLFAEIARTDRLTA